MELVDISIAVVVPSGRVSIHPSFEGKPSICTEVRVSITDAFCG